MGRYVPPATWSALHREWRLGRDSNKTVARRYNMGEDTIAQHARKYGWGERGIEQGDVLLAAEVTLDDILFELNKKLATIRDPATLATLRTAGDDARTIFSVTRDIRRATAEVKRVQAETRADGSASDPTITLLDFESAKKEVLDRFDNLAAWIAQDRAENPAAE